MTTILYDGENLHADRQGNPSRSEVTKVRAHPGNVVAAFSGMAGFCERAHAFVAEHGRRPIKDWPPFPGGENEVHGLILHGGRVYRIDGPQVVYEIEGDRPFALGSGGDYALGAYLAGATVEEAMRIAHECDVSTGATMDSQPPGGCYNDHAALHLRHRRHAANRAHAVDRMPPEIEIGT